MKKFLFLICLMGAMLFANKANARRIIFYGAGPKVSTIEKLPAEVKTDDGKHFNLGVLYNQFSIFLLPMWNYGTTKYVLVSDDEETYMDIDDETLNIIKERYVKNLPKEPDIPFWQKVIGKLPLLLLLIFFILDQIVKMGKDDGDPVRHFKKWQKKRTQKRR